MVIDDTGNMIMEHGGCNVFTATASFLCMPYSNGIGVGVRVLNRPYGPFKESYRKAAYKNGPQDIDSTVSIDIKVSK